MRKTIRFIQGAILGGVLGGVVVLLFTPGSGEDTRSAILGQFTQTKQQIHSAIEQRKKELQEEFESYTQV